MMQNATSEAPAAKGERALSRADYERFEPIVRRIAIRAARSVPKHITVQDLVGYGWVGLMEAYRRADPSMPAAEFEAYAAYRIRGAMLDYLRSLDPASRAVRNKSRAISRTINELTKQFERTPEEHEIAEAMGLEESAYRDMLSEVSKAGMARLELLDVEEMSLEAATTPPDEEANRRALSKDVSLAIQELPMRQQQILALYYQEECTLKEIGAILGVTESRVSQLHTEAMHRLRAAIGKE